MYRQSLSEIQYEDNVLICKNTLQKWKPNERAITDVQMLQKHWEILGWANFAENDHFERLIGELGEYVDEVTFHRIVNPKFYYYDENDREPIPSILEVFSGVKNVSYKHNYSDEFLVNLNSKPSRYKIGTTIICKDGVKLLRVRKMFVKVSE